MPSLYYGMVKQDGVPQDEKTVRQTATPVDVSAPPAMQTDMPEMGELETDTNPTLGMAPRQMASAWHEGVKSVPQEELDAVASGTDANAIVNRQVSSSGFAASREAAGQSNKNLSYAVGIEPVGDLRPGGKFGNEYFVRDKREVQEGMESYMTPPPGYDVSTRALVNEAGKEKAMKASNPYTIFWENYRG